MNAKNARRGAPEKEKDAAPEKEMAAFAATLGRRALGAARMFGRRLFVHAAAAVCGLSAAFAGESAMDGFSVYTGLVCLFARDMSVNRLWLGPFGAGVVQAAVFLASGFSFPSALFWGGGQTWVQRLLLKKTDMGTEWAALLLLLPGVFQLLPKAPSPFTALALFAGVGLAGRVAVLLLAREPRKKKTPGTEQAEPEKVARHRASLAELEAKLQRLPKNVRGVAESIAATTADILESMARDAGDLEPGHRFLHRYLTVVHSLVDKHIRLARENVITPDIVEALEKSEETLVRLDAVFAKEYGLLLKNDVADFSADIAVIDTLLKMDGKGG